MQRRHDFAARAVAIYAQNPIMAVRRFAAKNIGTFRIAIETHTKGFQIAYAVGGGGRQNMGNGRVNQSGTRSACVFCVRVDAIVRCQRRSNAALRPVACRAFAALATG